eukprot:scaffold398_cov356-Pavlova_lutheri.AAC.3
MPRDVGLSDACTRIAGSWALLSYGSTKGWTCGALDDDTGRLSAHAPVLRTFKEFSTRPRRCKIIVRTYGGESVANIIALNCPARQLSVARTLDREEDLSWYVEVDVGKGRCQRNGIPPLASVRTGGSR